jgi:RluA family pseudouridine synthase
MQWNIDVLFRDEDILVVDKPAGYLSVPDRYDPEEPVVAAALVRDKTVKEGELLVVHRLDKDSSGVLLFALNAEAHRLLSLAFETRSVKKSYRALIRGAPPWEETSCDYPLRPDGDKQHRTVIDGGHGKPSVTRFKLVANYGPYSLVEAEPETGRTHQIRVHLAALGFPIVADPLYGDGKALYLSSFKRGWRGDPRAERPLLARTALHAATLELKHPRSGEALVFEAPLPKDLRATITQLEKR